MALISLQSNFVDAGLSVGASEGLRFDSSSVSKGLRALILSIEHRNNQMIPNFNHSSNEPNPDIRYRYCTVLLFSTVFEVSLIFIASRSSPFNCTKMLQRLLCIHLALKIFFT